MKEGLTYFSDTYLTLIGLVTFFTWFLIMTYRVYKMGVPEFYDKMAALPLFNEEES